MSHSMSAQQVRPAGFFSRFVAFCLDLVLISVINLLILVGISLVISFFNLRAVIPYLPASLQNLINAIIVNIEWLIALLGTFFGLLYFIFFWVIASFTPGMALLGLRVIRTNGQHLGVGRAILRLIGYWVSALPLFLGFIWILFDNRRQGWHDKIAQTYVVYPSTRQPLNLLVSKPGRSRRHKKLLANGQED